VQVLYFAALRDLAGRAEERIVVPDSVRTVAEFVAHLEQLRPALAGKMGAVRVALDEDFAEPNAELAEVRVVALIPPVAGG
jgi:sulfur-carrier protein